MNTIRTIEGATLISVGVFCAAALVNVGLRANNLLPSEANGAASTVMHLPPVVISAHRLSAADKAELLDTHSVAADALAAERSARRGVAHAG
jgi:hypothetical protein